MHLEWYHYTLIIAAVIATWAAWRVPRAPQWIALSASFYVASAMWHNVDGEFATEFGALTNLIMICLLYEFADQRWEMRLWNAFQLMIVVDLLYMTGMIADKFVFAAALEIINLAALLFIIGTGMAERLDGVRLGSNDSGWSGTFHRALWAERSDRFRPPWSRR